MPVLNWIGKDKIVNHDKDVPFKLLKKNQKLSLGKSKNLIVEGDNLEALKALMPFYYGKVKCVYIDPPYNTGNEKWVYNDKVNSPKIKEWFHKTVGAEGEDLTRHDKWLCMMYPRLKLLKDLLSEDGAIFISIDDNEQHHLRFIMDDIFGEENFLVNISWRKKKEISSDNKGFSSKVEYLLAYSKSKLFTPNKVPLREEYVQSSFKNSNNDPKGHWRGVAITVSKGHQGGGYEYEVVTPSGKKINRKWLYPQESFNKLKKESRIYFGADGSSIPQRIIYLNESTGQIPDDLWLDVGTNKDGKNEINQIFGKDLFDTPKPVNLVKNILKIASEKHSIILDSFSGSGTTGHAVLDMNKEDGGNRKFILVEMEKDIARSITADRIRKVSKGYSYKNGTGKTIKVAGLGGGFEYVELGEALFNSDGSINSAVSFADMASYVYFTETRTNLERKNIKQNFIGEYGGTGYYLLFKGIGENVLNRDFIKQIKNAPGRKVVYADKCLLADEILEKHQIVFKQIPYSVRIY